MNKNADAISDSVFYFFANKKIMSYYHYRQNQIESEVFSKIKKNLKKLLT